MGPVIEGTDLTESHVGRRGIVEVSFDVPGGEVFGSQGPTRAGKLAAFRRRDLAAWPHPGATVPMRGSRPSQTGRSRPGRDRGERSRIVRA